LAYRPWVTGLGIVTLVCLWPGLGTIMVFFLPGLLVAQTHELTEKARAFYWPSLIMAAILLSEVVPGGGGLMVAMELILMAWTLRYAFDRSWDIPRALIFTAGVFVLVFGLIAALFVHSKAVDVAGIYSSIEQGIDQGLDVYDLDPAAKEEIKSTMVELAPSMLVITILFFAYLNCIISNFFARRLGYGPFFGPRIEGFRLPEPFVWVGIVGGAGVLFGHGAFQIFSKNLLLVVLTLYCIQGAGMLRYFMLQYKVHRLIQAVVFLLLSSSWYGLLGLTVMGVSDVWTNVRHIPMNGDTSEVRS